MSELKEEDAIMSKARADNCSERLLINTVCSEEWGWLEHLFTDTYIYLREAFLVFRL